MNGEDPQRKGTGKIDCRLIDQSGARHNECWTMARCRLRFFVTVMLYCFCSIDPSKSDVGSLLPSWPPTSGRNGRLDLLRNSSLDVSGGSRVGQERLAAAIYYCSFTLNQSIFHNGKEIFHNAKDIVLFEQRFNATATARVFDDGRGRGVLQLRTLHPW
jgi:hypothetical protein